MSHTLTIRRTVSCLLVTAVAFAALQAGCGDTSGSAFSPNVDVQPNGSGNPELGFGEAGSSGSPGLDVDATGILDVAPATATINVTIVNGVVTAPAQPFVASYNGQAITGATWLFDRGELGDVSPAGVFTANGTNVGEGIVTARYGAREGTAKVKIVVNATQNGLPDGADAGTGGFGGLGGVGGEPLGPKVGDDVITKLKTQANVPASAQELGFLYPYDLTVWPRGLLPPLLMWQTTHEASAVYVKLSQGNYSFEGTYSVSQHAAGSDARKRVRLEEGPWRTATSGNAGDDLKLEVKIYSSSEDKVYGPITRTWKVAPGVLKGTVYYNSYDSFVTTGGGGETGGVIKIKPRSPDPELAASSMSGKCHGCHTVSADGSTLFAQDGRVDFGTTKDDYRNGASYDLKQSSPPRTSYVGAVTPADDRKFVWSAPYPDGSFALSSYGYAREAFSQGGASKLYSRAAGAAEVPATNLNQVTSAVTPSFSPDGRKVAFNFWAGPGNGTVTAGGGRSLAVFDFTCGATAGSTTCTPGVTPLFSGLREIYRDNARWPGWPSFLPDASAVVFHNTLVAADKGSGNECRAAIVQPPPNINNCQLTTWKTPDAGSTGATAEIWLARDAATASARRLDALNGIGAGGTSFLPASANHPDDTKLNYMPTVNPVASGGYYWVVFTSRRLYGNVLTGNPHDWSSSQKKLWVAAIDINNPNAIDPSHPAFYLPGQELHAGNSRGFWVVDPCKANGQGCETGDECCNGFCRKDATSGALVCQDKPPGGQCSQEFEKCTVDADCCDPKFQCIAGKCTRPDPVVK
ncbi:MAG TPA: hypothetical protein VM925_21195 [Labilithrix sp.]|nr:hypothetical protein [Labilithrix sp.]